MEYNQLFPYLNRYLPTTLSTNSGFTQWLSQPEILEKFAALLIMTLPGIRTDYYESTDVAEMRKKIFDYTNEITKTLGFYPIIAYNGLLSGMTIFN